MLASLGSTGLVILIIFKTKYFTLTVETINVYFRLQLEPLPELIWAYVYIGCEN